MGLWIFGAIICTIVVAFLKVKYEIVLDTIWIPIILIILWPLTLIVFFIIIGFTLFWDLLIKIFNKILRKDNKVRSRDRNGEYYKDESATKKALNTMKSFLEEGID